MKTKLDKTDLNNRQSQNVEITKILETAERQFESNKFASSEKLFFRVLSLDPNNFDAHFFLCRIYRNKRKFDLAIKHGRYAIKLAPHERNTYLNLGLACEMAGNIRLAKKWYKKELSQNPSSPETLYNIGYLYFGCNCWQQAAKYLSQCFQTGYQHEQEMLVADLGFCYYKINDHKQYLQLYQKYTKMVPTAGWAMANLGVALLRNKNYRAAISKLSLAKRIGVKTSVDAKLALARKKLVASKMGN